MLFLVFVASQAGFLTHLSKQPNSDDRISGDGNDSRILLSLFRSCFFATPFIVDSHRLLAENANECIAIKENAILACSVAS